MAYSTRVRYGLRLLVRLALQDTTRYLSINEIAQEEGISLKYLEQIVSHLKPLGILESSRGAHGGYSLVGDPAQIRLDLVFERLGGLAAPVPCVADEQNCGRVTTCTTRPFWKKLADNQRNFLHSLTLADVVAEAACEKNRR